MTYGGRFLGAFAVAVGVFLVVAVGLATFLLQPLAHSVLPRHHVAVPTIPDGTIINDQDPRYVNVPAGVRAAVFLSPLDGGLLNEWTAGAKMRSLGMRYFDGYTDWLLVRDPAGGEGWMGEVFLSTDYVPDPATAAASGATNGDDGTPTGETENYVGDVTWDGAISYCVNPAGGPPGLDGDAFVQLVDEATSRWQTLAGGVLPLDPRGRCDNDPQRHNDGMTTVGWSPNLGLMIAALTWPDVDQGVAEEMDIVLSRGFFQRLQARDPTRTLRTCVLSTVVHEFGHVLGLEHPQNRALLSSMQAVGASRCDKGQPTEADRTNLLRIYAPSASR